MNKIISDRQLEKVFSDNPILLVSGSFDVLHLGHLRFLSKAKSQVPSNTKLLVIVLSDEEIKKRKGINRPLFSLEERIEALSYIEAVDYILPWTKPWEEQRTFVSKYKPAYLAVVEGDVGYENKKAIIKAAGGKFITIKKTDEFSSSSIISRLGL